MYGYQGYGYQSPYGTPNNYMQRAYNPQTPQVAQPQVQPQAQQL